jgi:RimJ/RimL family protein N-acetyltransferase
MRAMPVGENNTTMTGVGGAWIRAARGGDGAALLALTAAVDAASPFLSREPGEPPVWFYGDAERDLAAFVARANCAAFLAVAGNGVPIGFLTAAGGRWRRGAGVATLSLAVLPEWRGQGLGAALMETAHRWADAAGLHRLQLVVVEANAGARRLYERLGYADEGRTRGSLIRGGVAHDERIMARVRLPEGAPVWPDLVVPSLPAADIRALVIEPAVDADAGALWPFDGAVRRESPFLLRGPEEAFASLDAAAVYLRSFDGQRGVALAARLDGGLAGLAALRAGGLAGLAHEVELLVAVRREYWGSGIGARLAAAGEAWARGRGLRRLAVRVMAHNRRARALFERRGFEAEARLRATALVDGRYTDHILLAKALF